MLPFKKKETYVAIILFPVQNTFKKKINNERALVTKSLRFYYNYYIRDLLIFGQCVSSWHMRVGLRLHQNTIYYFIFFVINIYLI